MLGAVIDDRAATQDNTFSTNSTGGVPIYVFDITASRPSDLARDRTPSLNLLFAPIVTNRMGWRKGSFVPIDRPDSVDTLSRHCFENTATLRVHDERGEIVDPSGCEWIGRSGLTAYEGIIDLAEEALGLADESLT